MPHTHHVKGNTMVTRNDVWKLGSGWNDNLLWYAKAVVELQKKPILDRTSWRYLAAMHGFRRKLWLDSNVIAASDALPLTSETDILWNQCQHGSWYFLPWHRGYLAAFEAIVAKTISDNGGPKDWALPYWNYLDVTNPNARHIPDAFLAPKLPDGTPNPLSNLPRGGVKIIGPAPFYPRDINLAAMTETEFTVKGGGANGFGGSTTTFSHRGSGTGALEANPHNSVHVLVGGITSAGDAAGYLTDPDLAGLDPLFWLHHCNIDRLWSAWQAQPSSVGETSKVWVEGPADRKYAVPDATGVISQFVARDTLKGGKFYPTYAELSAGTGVAPTSPSIIALHQGGTVGATTRLLGANKNTISVGASSASTTLTLEPANTAIAVSAMGPPAPDRDPAASRLFLKLENIRGKSTAGVLDVYVNLPAGAEPWSHPEYRADCIALFGLANATEEDGQHSGNGLSFTIDITDLARRLKRDGDFDPAQIRVLVIPAHGGSDERPITVDKISLSEIRTEIQPPN